jgi:hypothetical protein
VVHSGEGRGGIGISFEASISTYCM